MVNTLCHMILQCQTRLASSMAMLINHVFFHVGFSTKACHGFGRPQTWELNIYICVGTSLIGWLDGKLTLSHGFSVPDSLASTMAMLINHVFFHVCFSTKACHGFGRPQTWALNIYICVGTSLIGWLDDNHTLPHDFSVPVTSSM